MDSDIKTATETFSLGNEFTIHRATELRDDLLSLFSQTEKICIDISDIEIADSAGVQLLLALMASNREVQINGDSEALRAACQRIGVDLDRLK